MSAATKVGLSIAAFFDRVGGVLVHPRRTLSQVLAGRGGLRDVAVLMGLRLVAEQADLLARAVLGVRVLGVRALITGVAQAGSSLLPEMLGIVVGAVALALVGKTAARGRELDLSGYSWIAFLAVRVVAALVLTALQRAPSAVEERVIDGVALAWSAAMLGLAMIAVRTEKIAGAGAVTPPDVTEKR